MRKYILFIFIILLPLAGADDLYSSETLNLSANVGSSIHIEPEEEDYRIEHMNINLGFVPMATDSQKIHSIKTEPPAKDLNDSKLFQWEKLRTRKISFGLEAELTSNYDFVKIEDKKNFPVKNLEDDMLEYLKETTTIDIDEDIEEVAQELAEGEDDLFRVIHNFAEWIDKNFEYNLSATPRGGTYKASWVLENEAGVCGEFTNLFIAFCRSVGIPARFVSGVAYTTDERIPETWGPHAWAEVYFPGDGWIPVDVTFREVGYVNPARVVILKDLDARNPSTSYDWKTENADVETKPLDINVSVENKSGPVESLLDIESSVAYKEINFGSYNVLNVNVRNPNEYYVPASLRLSKTRGIEILDDERNLVLMEPSSEKNLYYLFRLGEDFEGDYDYNFRITARTKRNSTGTSTFMGGDDFSYYTKSRAEDYIESREKEGEKEYSKNVFFNCKTDRDNYLLTDHAEVVCQVNNTGDLDLMDAEICLEDYCSFNDIKSGEEKEIVFLHTLERTGSIRLRATFEHMDAVKYDTVIVNSFERPKLDIREIEAPRNVSYEEEFNIEFSVVRENKAPINETTVNVEGGGINQMWRERGFEDDNRYVIEVNRHVLNDIENKINFSIKYTDEIRREFYESRQIKISVANLTSSQRVIMYANQAQGNIKNNWLEYLLVLIGSVVVAVLVSRYILNPVRPGSKTF